MAEENQEEAGETERLEKQPLWKEILTFIVTVLWLAMLFSGTCLPLFQSDGRVVEIYTAVFSVICLVWAAKVRRNGVRAAFLVMGVLLGWIALNFLL